MPVQRDRRDVAGLRTTVYVEHWVESLPGHAVTVHLMILIRSSVTHEVQEGRLGDVGIAVQCDGGRWWAGPPVSGECSTE